MAPPRMPGRSFEIRRHIQRIPTTRNETRHNKKWRKVIQRQGKPHEEKKTNYLDPSSDLFFKLALLGKDALQNAGRILKRTPFTMARLHVTAGRIHCRTHFEGDCRPYSGRRLLIYLGVAPNAFHSIGL